MKDATRPQVQSSPITHDDFTRLWAAHTISVLGAQFARLALPLVAVTVLQASPGQMGFLSAAATVPYLAVGVLAGVGVDKYPRRPVLIASDLGRALILAVVPLAAATDALSMTHLYVVALLIGAFTVSFEAAQMAYVPVIVPRERLVSCNSRLEASRSAAQLLGPGITGAAVQLLSAPVAVVGSVLSFLVSSALVAGIKAVEHRVRSSGESYVREMLEGMGKILGERTLWSLVACAAAWNFFGFMWGAVYVVFATRDLGLSPLAIGAMWSVGNVAGLAGAVAVPKLISGLGIGRVIVGGAFVNGLCAVPIFLATPSSAIPLLVLSSLLQSLGTQCFNIGQVSLRQALVPPRLHGRVFATMRSVAYGAMPLGSLAGGVLSGALGMRTGVGIAALGGLFSFLWLFASPLPRLLTLPDASED